MRAGEGLREYVVLHRGSWWVTTVPVSDRVPTEVEHLIERHGWSAGAPGADAPAVGPAVQIRPCGLEPAWMVAGRATARGVELEALSGPMVLDALDLRLLDLLGRQGELPVDPELEQRLQRLESAGLLRATPSIASPPQPTGAPSPQPPDEPDALCVGRPAPASVPSLDHRVPVYAVWDESVGPLLALGMLTAAARSWNQGALTGDYEIRRPETAQSFLDDLARRSGPAVLLASDYVWSLERNLELARQARSVNPELVVIHGGPSSPADPIDAEEFLDRHGDVAQVLVRGEGELVLCRVLASLAPTLPSLDLAALREVPGLTFVDPTDGRVVRTPDQERIAALDELPSPYLTGEFDHIPPEAWVLSMSIETNRGCPYGCTFCDWGSATNSRIRWFDLDRVEAEFEWAARRGMLGVQLCDANLGITSRDVEVAARLAEVRRRHGSPSVVSFTPAKNTVRHLPAILDHLIDAGFLISTAISLQTTDPTTLAAVNRSNISVEGYLELAAELRRRGFPIQGDVLIGLPGQTYRSFRRDLQFFVDHEIEPRCWSVRVLPNSPMNEPGYRTKYLLRTGQDQIVTSTADMSEQDRARMLALRRVQVIADKYATLAHVMRYLQWDHGVPASEFMECLLDQTTAHPDRYPDLTWLLGYFDQFPGPPTGWVAFYSDVARFATDRFGLEADDSGLRCVLELQLALMPTPGRRFPHTVHLPHDYLAYYRSATAELSTTGRCAVPEHRLTGLPPADFQVVADPLDLCGDGLSFVGDSRDESMLGSFWLGIGSAYDLLSPLTRVDPSFRSIQDVGAVASPTG